MNAYRDQYAQLFRGGRNVVLIAISADPDTMQQSWARDAEFPFLFASDTNTAVGRMYGALSTRAPTHCSCDRGSGPLGPEPAREIRDGKKCLPIIPGAIVQALGHRRLGSLKRRLVVESPARAACSDGFEHPLGVGALELRDLFVGPLTIEPNYDRTVFERVGELPDQRDRFRAPSGKSPHLVIVADAFDNKRKGTRMTRVHDASKLFVFRPKNGLALIDDE